MNKVILIGHTGKDPEVKLWDNGKTVEITLATTERWKDRQTGEPKSKTTWHNLRFHGNVSNVVEQYVRKGDKIAVMGKIDNYQYEGKDGTTKYGSRVDVRELDLLGSANRETREQQAIPEPMAGSPNPPQPPAADPNEDLPF